MLAPAPAPATRSALAFAAGAAHLLRMTQLDEGQEELADVLHSGLQAVTTLVQVSLACLHASSAGGRGRRRRNGE